MQISAVQTHHDLVAVASSRLEGSTWDGAVTLLRASASPSPSSSSSSSPVVTVELTRLAVHGTTYGIPALTWCGASPSQEPPLLAATQDNGDVLLFAIKQEGVNFAILPTTTLADHDDLVSALAATPGGDFLATGGWDCAVKVWGLGGSSVRPLMNWQAHSDHVTALAWRGGGGRREGGRAGGNCQVASAGKDRCVKLWDVRVEGSKRECLRLVGSHAQIPLALAWATSSSSSSPFSSLPSSPPPGLEGSSAMHVDNNNREKESENEGNDVFLSVAFDDGSVSLVDLRMLPSQGNGNGAGGKGGGIATYPVVKAHKTRANVLAFSPSFGSSFPALLASGGDDAQVVVSSIVFEIDGGGVNSFCTMADGAGMRTDMQHTDYVRGLGWLGTGEGKGQGQEGGGAAAASSLLLLPPPGVLLSGGWDGQLKGWGWREAGEEGETK